MNMSAIIICGGFATRMGKTCERIPKAMLEFNGTPFLVYLVSHFLRQGIREVVISTGHLSESIFTYFDNDSWKDRGVKVVREDCPLDTGGARKFASQFTTSEHAFTCYGDTTLEIDLAAAYKQHVATKAKVTAVVTLNSAVQNQGAILVSSGETILEFAEKPKEERVSQELVTSTTEYRASSTGAYIIRKDFLESLSDGKLSLEQEVIPQAVKEKTVCAFNNGRNFFLDWGTPERYNEMLRNAHLIEKIYGQPLK